MALISLQKESNSNLLVKAYILSAVLSIFGGIIIGIGAVMGVVLGLDLDQAV